MNEPDLRYHHFQSFVAFFRILFRCSRLQLLTFHATDATAA